MNLETSVSYGEPAGIRSIFAVRFGSKNHKFIPLEILNLFFIGKDQSTSNSALEPASRFLFYQFTYMVCYVVNS